ASTALLPTDPHDVFTCCALTMLLLKVKATTYLWLGPPPNRSSIPGRSTPNFPRYDFALSNCSVPPPVPGSARTIQLPTRPKLSIRPTGRSLSFRLKMLPVPDAPPATQLRLEIGLLSSKAQGNCPASVFGIRKPIKKLFVTVTAGLKVVL